MDVMLHIRSISLHASDTQVTSCTCACQCPGCW